MADLYDTLSADEQGNVRKRLWQTFKASACPGLDVTGFTGPDSFLDAGNRFMAVGCFQVARGMTPAAPGALDEPTYTALMLAMSTGEKVAIGALAFAGVLWVAMGGPRRKRRRGR